MVSSSPMNDFPLPPPRSSFENHSKQGNNPDTEPTSTKSIPIPNHIRRTESEIHLSEDLAIAEYRDNCMYNRLVDGMIRNQDKFRQKLTRSKSHDSFYQNGRACLKSIVHTHFDTHTQATTTIRQEDKVETGGFLAPTMPPTTNQDEDDDDNGEDPVFTLDM